MRFRRVGATAAAVIGLAGGLAACHNGGHSTSPNVPGASVVIIRDMAYNPRTLTVKAGTTVDWKWNDSGVDHDVVSVGAGPLHSPLKTGGDYDYTFTTPGTYNYHCTIHPGMDGTVVVTS